MNAAREGLGGIDMLVNNAGWTLTTPFLEESEDYWRRVIDINLWGTILCTRAAVEWMVDVDTLLHVADLGCALGGLLGERGISLAAWTLRDEGAEVSGALLRRLFAAGVTTVIADDAPALARYAAAL